MNNTDDKPEDEKPGFWETTGGFLTIAGLIIALMAANFWVIYHFADPTNRGIYGDVFGGSTALFSGLAFSGLIITLVIQRKELRYQREELKASNREFALQRFDSAFFGMIKMLNDHIATIKHQTSNFGAIINSQAPSPDYGRAAISQISSNFLSKYDDTHRVVLTQMDRMNGTDNFESNLKLKIEDMFIKKDDILGPYFRILYNVFRRISEDEDLDSVQKINYARIARSHLSLGELNMIFLNGVTDNGSKFKVLIEKFAILKHTQFSTRLRLDEIDRRYDKSAFGSRAIIPASQDSEQDSHTADF